MSRLAIPALDDAPEASKPILAAVKTQLGVVPNMFRLFSSSPAALKGLTSLSGALTKSLDVKTRERIALAVAQVNGCNYCLSAHTYLGLNFAKISPEEVALNRKGSSSDPKADAAVRFSATVTETRATMTSLRFARRPTVTLRCSKLSPWSSRTSSRTSSTRSPRPISISR